MTDSDKSKQKPIVDYAVRAAVQRAEQRIKSKPDPEPVKRIDPNSPEGRAIVARVAANKPSGASK